jgi:OmpA-OmpF porin, OOP family
MTKSAPSVTKAAEPKAAKAKAKAKGKANSIANQAPDQKTPSQTSAIASKPIPAPKSFSWRRSFLTLTLRLLLLGAGGTVTAIVGIAVAHLYPDQTQKLPLVSELLQQAESQIKSRIKSANLPQLPFAPASPSVPAAVPVTSPVNSPLASPLPAPLSDSERQQLKTELTQLQAELQTLTSKSPEPLAERVEEIQKKIQAIQTKLNDFTASDAAPFVVAPAVSSTVDQPLLVTLPSDALFEANQAKLRPATAAILSSILADLQRYPGASIQVAAYTDSQQSPERDRQKSLEQAKAVQTYLANQFKKSGKEIHWVTIGQGHNRPLAPDNSPENRQRNRRIEISITP